jgi:hypothetical protein
VWIKDAVFGEGVIDLHHKNLLLHKDTGPFRVVKCDDLT